MASLKVHSTIFHWKISIYPPQLEFTEPKLLGINYQINQTEAAIERLELF